MAVLDNCNKYCNIIEDLPPHQNGLVGAIGPTVEYRFKFRAIYYAISYNNNIHSSSNCFKSV